MTLYALKIGGEYVRDLKDGGWSRVSVAKCSVFPSIADAEALARKISADTAETPSLIRMELVEEEIAWP